MHIKVCFEPLCSLSLSNFYNFIKSWTFSCSFLVPKHEFKVSRCELIFFALVALPLDLFVLVKSFLIFEFLLFRGFCHFGYMCFQVAATKTCLKTKTGRTESVCMILTEIGLFSSLVRLNLFVRDYSPTIYLLGHYKKIYG